MRKDGHDGDHALGHLVGFFSQVLTVRCREKPNAPLTQEGYAQNVRFDFASKATHVLYDDCPHTIGFDSIQQSCEARAVLDSIGSAYGCIVEIVHDENAGEVELQILAQAKKSECWKTTLPSCDLYHASKW